MDGAKLYDLNMSQRNVSMHSLGEYIPSFWSGNDVDGIQSFENTPKTVRLEVLTKLDTGVLDEYYRKYEVKSTQRDVAIHSLENNVPEIWSPEDMDNQRTPTWTISEISILSIENAPVKTYRLDVIPQLDLGVLDAADATKSPEEDVHFDVDSLPLSAVTESLSDISLMSWTNCPKIVRPECVPRLELYLLDNFPKKNKEKDDNYKKTQSYKAHLCSNDDTAKEFYGACNIKHNVFESTQSIVSQKPKQLTPIPEVDTVRSGGRPTPKQKSLKGRMAAALRRLLMFARCC